jgi:hypothetical protein
MVKQTVMMTRLGESGVGIPKIGYTVFIRNPINIRMTRLSPAENSVLRIIPCLDNLRIWRRKNPGINER